MDLTMNDLIVAGVQIRADEAGRYSLNDLHKAAVARNKAGDSQRPGNFLKSPEVEAFARALTDATGIASVETIKGGPKQGSYGARLIVLRYAAWIDPTFELEVYGTFDAAVSGTLPPKIARAVAAKSPVMVAAGMLPALVRALRCCGIDKNAAAIGANQIATAQTGVNLLALAGQQHLPTPDQEICFTPTELGNRRCVKAHTMNRALADAGLQERIGEHWVPTAKGRPHAVVLDTGKSHGNGTPIQQVKWKDSVLAEVAL
jgi:hypothetical protein